MKTLFGACLVVLFLSCKENPKPTTDAQEIVDRAIEASGGDRYLKSRIRFTFRDRQYESYREGGQRVLKRFKTRCPSSR